jgi:hypothetical protein
MRGHVIVSKQSKLKTASVVTDIRLRANIPVVSGPIVGIPIEEMEAWEDAQNDGIEVAEPKPRRIE